MEVNTTELAIFGGAKAISRPFSRYQTIGEEEVAAAQKVLESGMLSQFAGSWGPDFFGGPRVKEFERACESYFGVKHAITVNSWTSGLVAALGAVGVSPGDEVIVPSWTMAASATAILHWNGIPVFADINPLSFCLDVGSVSKLITRRTVAVVCVDIFGQSADMLPLLELAHQLGIKVISDTAQAPGAKVGNQFAGTLADIGGISLNYHKHIHTGEGGVLFTDSDHLADRMRLIRNHAEAVVEQKGVTQLDNMVGFNFRLGEIESAIGIEQLKKLPQLVEKRQRAAAQLSEGLRNLAGLRLPSVLPKNSHVFYVFGMVLEGQALDVGREKISAALRGEGVEGLMEGYANVHMLPMYQKKIAFGAEGFPWTSDYCENDVSYARGICPVSEELHEKSFLGLELCLFDYTHEEVQMTVQAFQKVWGNLEKLITK